jgi:hypothetical protein
MSGGSEYYAVITAEDRIPPNRILAEGLSKSRNVHRVDAAIPARGRNYILDTNCTVHQAEVLQRVLAEFGVASVVVPMEYFTQLGQPRLLSNANCLESCFEIEPVNKAPFTVQWPDVAMISYGRVEEQPSAPSETDQMGLAGAYVMDTSRYPGETVLGRHLTRDRHPRVQPHVHECLDVFVGYLKDDEFAAHFRVIAARFCYDYLGDRKQLASMANFRLFIDDIVRHAPNVILTDRASTFLSDRPAGRPFAGFDVFDEYSSWSVAISRARAEKDEGTAWAAGPSARG